MNPQEERLAHILDSLFDASSGDSREERLNAAIDENPDLADEIRELAATARVADDVAALQSLSLPTQISSNGSPSSEAMPTAVGIQIGDYELVEEIGRGGMGVVYRAHQKSLGRDVAIKMIANANFAAPDDRARLRAEAFAAGQLSHPNVVPVYDVGEHQGHPWFCMKYVEGETLSQRLQRGPMDPHDAVRLLLPVVDAIETAHATGTLHRDLKPSNILIATDGTPFVTDFGLAKRTRPSVGSNSTLSSDGGITQSGAILGTPAWMSPEQAAGQTKSTGTTSDVYSLGAILYAMLTGRPPFQAASPMETLLMVIEQDAPDVRTIRRAIDSDLAMIVLKCLQKPQDLRYASAGAMAKDLRAWMNHEPVSARSSTLTSILMRLFRESHHAAVLHNWGVLWMWHSLVLLGLCLTTNVIQLMEVSSRWPYLSLWVVGLGIWAVIFWNLRHRSGPVTAVERQIAHVWGGSMIASSLLFALESIMNRPVLEFSPMLGVIAGIVFLVKAGTLSGAFYLQAVLLFTTALFMAAIQQSDFPNVSIALFGIVSAAAFFLPGLKYYRQKQ